MRTRRAYMPAHSYAPNLAPMVDVVMVILVFFMLGTSLAVSEGVLPTELPSKVGPGGSANVTIIPVVRITLLETAEPNGCQIIVMGRALADNSFPALEHLLREKFEAGADPKGRVLIGASPGVEYQNVISAMDACVQAGFGNIQFSVNPHVATAVE